HYAELLVLDPADDAARAHLADLGRRTGRLDRYADALARAGDALATSAGDAADPRAIALFFEAGRVRVDEIGDARGATELYARIFDASSALDETMLDVCRRLDRLLVTDDQREKRLDVLVRRAAIEPEPAEKRRLLAEAARLAEALGAHDRAEQLWEQVLLADPSDREAHEVLIALHERSERWDRLIFSLERAAAAPKAGAVARDYLMRAARVLADLARYDEAIDTWRRIEERFGQSEET